MSRYAQHRIAELRTPLLALHRALISATFIEFEKQHGRVEGTERLELLREHPAFRWLQPISSLIVRIDLAEEADAPRLVAEAERLLAPADRGDELGSRYLDILQAHPEVVLAHAELRRAVERTAMN
jgi:hypothetical protein